MPTIHIGGTNGKGSVSTLVAAALAEAGWRVGLYTSPHLVSFRERIRVDGVPIGEDAWPCGPSGCSRSSSSARRRSSRPPPPSPSPTSPRAARRSWWPRWGWADGSTAPMSLRPLVSAVTKIERDHMKYLGDTLELIACEKAGIAKPGAPFVIGERDPALVDVLRREARKAVARARAEARGGCAGAAAGLRMARSAEPRGPAPAAECRRWRTASSMALPAPYRPPPRGHRRAASAAPGVPAGSTGGASGCSTSPTIPTGSGRWCASHRDACARRGPLHALVSILGDKEWPEMLVQLDRVIDRGVLTVAPTAASRGWNAVWLRRWLRDRGRPPARASWTLVPDFREALDAGAARARERCWSPARFTPSATS